ncbi:MAG: integrase arm-type DNA-binding domain-containing protein [Desulfuromonadales bacterium]|nr:integrase arm-type DNA-binding domain-containing protein [Desulfuromonadales bacterium]
MALSDIKVRNIKPTDKQSKFYDSDGLYLLVAPSSKGNRGKRWRFKYRFDGKEKLLALGTYPEVSLALARKHRDEARQLIANGSDPAQVKQEIKALELEQRANTFEKLAIEWQDRQIDHLAERTRLMIMRRMKKDVFPAIGHIPLADLSSRMILDAVLRPIEDRGAIDLAHRIRGAISQILRYGVACGLCDRDFTADLRGALKPIPRKHHAAFDADGTTDPVKVGALLRAIENYDGSIVVRYALQFHPLVATRPGELRHAEWTEIDFDAALWAIPAGRMKMKNPHMVPLSPQAVAILKKLHAITGNGKYLFPSIRSTAKPISDNTMNAGLRRLGYSKEEIVSHGWRAIFRTLADEVLQERIDIIEAQLAHQVKDALGRAYNRTNFLKERRDLMNRWGSYLDGLKKENKMIPLVKRTGSD